MASRLTTTTTTTTGPVKLLLITTLTLTTYATAKDTREAKRSPAQENASEEKEDHLTRRRRSLMRENKEWVIWASPKYDPGARDYTGQFATSLTEHGSEPMSNVLYTPNDFPRDPYATDGIPTYDEAHPAPDPLADYWAAWSLDDGIQRHPVLVVEDMENGYWEYVDFVIPRCEKLIAAFRERDWPIIWTNWVRDANDGLYGAIDRFYGPQGIKNAENPAYVFGPRASETVDELSPATEAEFARTIKSLHLSKFADMDEHGRSILYPMLAKWGVDTIILVGAWTDDCIGATVYDAIDAYGLDVVVIEDGVATASRNQGNALKIMQGGLAKIMLTDDVLDVIMKSSEDDYDDAPLAVAPGYREDPSPELDVASGNTGRARTDDAHLFLHYHPPQKNDQHVGTTVSIWTAFYVAAASSLLSVGVALSVVSLTKHRHDARYHPVASAAA